MDVVVTLGLLVAPIAVGFLAGLLLPRWTPWVFLVPIVPAAVYWVAVGWLADSDDVGRALLVSITLLYAILFVGLWAVGAAVGISIRSARRGSHPEDPEPALGDRRVQRR